MANVHYKLVHCPTPTPLIQEISLQHLHREILSSSLGLYLYSMETQKLEASNLTPAQLTKLQSLLGKFEEIFVLPSTLTPHRDHDHHIPLIPGTHPPNIRPYHYGPLQKTKIEKAVKELLDSGFIQPSHSHFSCHVFLVKKKEGTWRLCMDYRKLSSLTITNKYPIPLIGDLLDELYGALYFSKLDLRFSYHQIWMQPTNVEKTTFRTHEGHYEFLVMPFGITIAPATFQNLMNDIFKPYLRVLVLIFFDGILVYNKS